MSALRKITRSYLIKLLGQVSQMPIVIIGSRQMGKLTSLSGDDFGYRGMGVAKGGDSNARIEVEKKVAIDVLDDRTPASLHHERVSAGVTQRNVSGVAFNYLFRFWPRQ